MRYPLYAVLAVSGMALAARVVAGPITRPFAMQSPLNAESWFAVAGIVLLALRSRPNPSKPAQQRFAKLDLLAIAGIIAIALCAFAWTARFYFVSDDFLLLHHARAFPGWRAAFTTRGADGFFRPLGYLSYAATWRWAGAEPSAWHAIGFGLHIGNALLVYALASALAYSRFSAWLAATLFAVHGAHPEAVVWMAGRFDLLATFSFLAALVAFVYSWQAAGGRRFAWRLAAAVALIAALLTKESAFAFPLIAAWLLACYRQRGRGEWLTAASFLAITAAVFVWRWSLYGGIGGYLTPGGTPQVLSMAPLSAAKALLFRLWAILFFPISWSTATGLFLILAILIYLAALAWLFTAGSASRHAVFAFGFILLSALPALPLLLIGIDLEKSRLLYLPAAGFCLLLAAVVASLRSRLRIAIAGLLVVFQFAALQHNLGAWQTASAAVHSACDSIARCAARPEGRVRVVGLPRSVAGVYAFGPGLPACVSMRSGVQAQIDFAGQPSDSAGYACILTWDPATLTLR